MNKDLKKKIEKVLISISFDSELYNDPLVRVDDYTIDHIYDLVIQDRGQLVWEIQDRIDMARYENEEPDIDQILIDIKDKK